MKLGPVFREMVFKEKVYGRQTDHKSSSRAFGSGELNRDTTDSIFCQKSGPALAGLSTTALQGQPRNFF